MSTPSAAVPAPRRLDSAGGRHRFFPLLCALCLNLGIGLAVGTGNATLGVAVATVPVLVAVAGWIGVFQRGALIWIAFALPLSGLPLDSRLPGTGGTAIYITDVLLAISVGGWFVARLTARPDEPIPRLLTGGVLSWPFALLGVAVIIGVVRGHASWGTSYLSEPMRFLLYAAIGLAVTGLGARQAFRGLVAVFYVGTFVETLFAVYYVATGTSQTASASLSTGGSRALALSTAIYLAGALVLAILNVELNRGRGRVGLHAAVACLAVIDIGLSLGRTTFAAVGVILPVLVLGLRHARRTLLSYVPLLLPLLVLFVIVLLLIDPSLGSTLGDRLTGHLSNDNAVVERTREVDATLAGLNHHLSLGFGFGRPVSWLNTDGVTIRHSSGGSENSYVWLLAGGGVFAFVSFLFVILAFFADGFRRLRSAVDEARALVIFSLSMAFILLVNAITGPVLSDPTMLMTVWVAFMLPAAVRPPDAAP